MSILFFRISLYLPLFLKQKILKLKTMKQILFLLFFLPVYLYGQSAGPFEKELSILQKALNSKNAADLKPYLAENFTIAGFKGEKAYQILTAVLQQYPPVQAISLIKADTTGYFNLQIGITCPDTIRIQSVQLDREHRFTEINLARIQISNSAVTSPLRITSNDFLEIPFRQVGKLILIENVRINGKKGNFLVDTGAQNIIINSEFMKADTSMGIWFSKAITGEKAKSLQLLNIDTLDIHSMQITETKAYMMDLSHLEKSRKIAIAGLLGYPVWKDYEMHFDFKKHKLFLYKLTSQGNTVAPPYTKIPKIIIPFDLQNHLPIFEITYGSVNLKTAFDSGAESNAISPESLEKIPSRFYKTQKATKLTGAYKESMKTMKIRFPKTRIQNFLFKNMHCITTSLSHLNIDAIMGYELMKQHRLSLNYKRKEIRIY